MKTTRFAGGLVAADEIVVGTRDRGGGVGRPGGRLDGLEMMDVPVQIFGFRCLARKGLGLAVSDDDEG